MFIPPSWDVSMDMPPVGSLVLLCFFCLFCEDEVVSLRRGTCTLHGTGAIGLGSSPADPTSATVRFVVVHVADTQPHGLLDPV